MLVYNFKNNNCTFDKIKYLEKQIINAKNQIKKIDFYIKNLYEDKITGIINTNQFKELVNGYEKNREIYNSRIKDINKNIYRLKYLDCSINKYFLNKYIPLDKLNIIFVEEFIKSIYISEIINDNRNIKINWNL